MIHVYQKSSHMQVLKHFLDRPYKEFYLRELARFLEMDPMTLKRALDLLIRDDLLVKFKEKNMILYKANMENLSFRYQKISYNLASFKEKGLLQLIENNVSGLSSVVLFGSNAKGENTLDSDVDILVVSLRIEKDVSPNLMALLDREVNLIQMTPARWSKQSKENRGFYLDVITDGIPLFGQIPVVE